MTGVNADLATLLDYAGWATTPASHKRAVKNVEAELSRLREQLRECRDSFTEVERVAMRVVAAEARCAELQQALRLTLAGIPDPMHPAIPRKMADRIVAAQIVVLDALGENDGCDVEKAREALAGLDTPADSQEDKT